MKKTLALGLIAAGLSLSACGRQSPVEPRARTNNEKRALTEMPPEGDGTCRSGWLVAGDKCVPEDET
jgi:hypothetical protein